MSSTVKEKLKAGTEAQAEAIRKLPCYREVTREFKIEYSIAQELSKARKDADLTQGQLAAIMGTTQSVVSRIESGVNVSVETLARYADACGKRLEVHVVS